MSLIPSNIMKDLAALGAYIAERLDYDIESDPDLAIEKARVVVAGCRALMLRRPINMSQGGYGKGSGFSQEYEPTAMEKMQKDALAWLASRGQVDLGQASKMFGFFEGDGREYQRGFCEEVTRAS